MKFCGKSLLRLCVILFMMLVPHRQAQGIVIFTPGGGGNICGGQVLWCFGSIGGAIPSPSNLTYVNGGTLTAQGASSLGGAIINVDSGTLTYDNGVIINNGIALGVNPISLNVPNGTAIQNGSFTPYNISVFDGTRPRVLLKVGEGTLVINNTSPFQFMDKSIVVQEGELQIGDANSTEIPNNYAIFNGDITVSRGAMLSGHGFIADNVSFDVYGTQAHGNRHVINNGLVSPGGSIGTLNISGNYTQSASAILSIEVSPTQNSILNIGGTADLDGTLTIVFQNGVIASRDITYLNAGSVNGTFSNISYMNAPAGYYVVLTPTYSNTAASIHFGLLPVQAETYSSTTTVQFDNTHHATDIILDHFDTLDNFNRNTTQATGIAGKQKIFATTVSSDIPRIDSLVNSAPQTNTNSQLWLKSFGNLNSITGDGRSNGFDAHTGGLMMGLDRRLDKNLVLGMAAGYDHSNIDDHNGLSSNTTFDTARFSFYTAKPMKNITLGATFGYAHSWINTSRLISAAIGNTQATYSQDVLSVGLQGNLKRHLGRFNITPKIGVDYAHIFTSGFNETGAGAFNLSIRSKQNDSVQPFVGVVASTQYSFENGLNITPTAHIKYAREIMGGSHASTASLGGTSFSTGGVKPSKDMLTAGMGFTAQLDDKLDIYGGYDATLPIGNRLEHTFSLGVTFSF